MTTGFTPKPSPKCCNASATTPPSPPAATAGVRLLEKSEFDVILTDLRMADLDGLAILRKAKEEQPDAEVVVITGHGDVKTAVEAIKEGASHYLQKPVDLAELRAIVGQGRRAPAPASANRELRRQLDEKFGFEGVVGNSPKMHDVIARLRASLRPAPPC